MFPISDSIPARRFPFINLLLIGITVYVFIQQILYPDPEGFIFQYALVPSQVNFADWTSLLPFITSIFLHGGLLHILSNMWFLWIFGDNVEGHLDILTYPMLYLVSGIAGGLLQYAFMPTSSIPMLGASGAVAGVLGAYYVMFPHSEIRTVIPVFGFPAIVNIQAPIMLGYWFFLQIISGATSFALFSDATGGIAFWAHVGGFITGVILAKLLHKERIYE